MLHKLPTGKAPDPTDRHVGSRVRMRRMMLGISQEMLGKALHLSFQQVQKYEKGINRIGSGRMHRIAVALQVPVSFFFDGLPVGDGTPADHADASQVFITSADGVAVIKAFPKLSPRQRRAVAQLVTSLIEEE